MGSTPLLKVNKACEDSVLWATHKLEEAGLQAVRTFDLQTARLSAHIDCQCPHHGAEKCDCQMVVLLVYKGKRRPATMLVQSYNQTSWFYLINTPQQPIEYRLEKTIQEVLSLEIDPLITHITPV